MKLLKKRKYIAHFFQSFGGVYKKVGEKNFSLNADRQFSFKGQAFTLIYNEPIFEDEKGNMIYYFDYETGQLNIKKQEEDISLALEYLDDIANKHATADLIKASKEKLKWWEILLYASIGFMFITGYIMGKMGLF